MFSPVNEQTHRLQCLSMVPVYYMCIMSMWSSQVCHTDNTAPAFLWKSSRPANLLHKTNFWVVHPRKQSCFFLPACAQHDLLTKQTPLKKGEKKKRKEQALLGTTNHRIRCENHTAASILLGTQHWDLSQSLNVITKVSHVVVM